MGDLLRGFPGCARVRPKCARKTCVGLWGLVYSLHEQSLTVRWAKVLQVDIPLNVVSRFMVTLTLPNLAKDLLLLSILMLIMMVLLQNTQALLPFSSTTFFPFLESTRILHLMIVPLILLHSQILLILQVYLALFLNVILLFG